MIKYGNTARKKILAGIKKISNAVSVTLGGGGRTVIFENQQGLPTTTKDGVTVAKAVHLENKFEKLGADLIRDVSLKTNDYCGDGSSSSLVIAESLITHGFEQIDKGVSPIFIKKELQRVLPIVIEKLKKWARPIETKEQLIQVATIASQDEELGEMIGEILHKIGKDGVVTTTESSTFGITNETVQGLRIDKGYISPAMATNFQKRVAEIKDAKILIVATKIATLNDIVPLYDRLVKDGTSELVVIADDYSEEVLGFMLANKLKAYFNTLAIKAPSFGDNRKDLLEDIAITTGAQVISRDKGMKIEDTTIEMLGEADRVVATKDHTTIINGRGDKKKVKERISQIKNELKESTAVYDKEKCQERIGKFSGGVSVIRVGSPSEVESGEKQFRIDDAIHATKAAMEEGIIPGGGIPLLNIALEMNGESTVEQILTNALSSPFRKIVENAGDDPDEIKKELHGEGGYNVSTREYGDMFEMGIVDPLKVTRVALENSFSVAEVILTTECLITLPKSSNVNNNG